MPSNARENISTIETMADACFFLEQFGTPDQVVMAQECHKHSFDEVMNAARTVEKTRRAYLQARRSVHNCSASTNAR